MAKCRSCGREVLWAATKKGKKMPVDPAPRPDGNVQLLSVVGEETKRAKVLSKVELEEARRAALYQGHALKLHVSHFSSCPDAPQHRRAA